MPHWAWWLAVVCAGDDGIPDHPRVFYHPSELSYLSQNLDHPWFSEAWAETKARADRPWGPLIDQDWCFTDVIALYNSDLNVDACDLYYLALAYVLTGDAGYATEAQSFLDNIVARVDVSYKSGLSTWDAIFWDLMGIRMVIAIDLLWNGLDPASRDGAAVWCDTLAESVRTLHTKDTNGGYYKQNDCAGNIKSWDNALIGMTGYLLGDAEKIAYAIEDPANAKTKSGELIELHYRSQIRNGTVEEADEPGSQYGHFRAVDWHRSIEDGKDYNESVGYAIYHQQANEMLCRPALRHGLDLYRLGTRAVEGDQRHHAIQAIDRAGHFAALEVDPADNEWRTWDGADWIYTQDDAHYAGRSALKMAGFCNEVTSPDLDDYRASIIGLVEGGLVRSNEYYADFHVLGYAWPFQLVQMAQGLESAGDLAGRVVYETTPAVDGEVSMYRAFHRYGRRMKTPVEVDADGSFDARSLGVDVYWMIAKAEGFKSTLGASPVAPNTTTQVADFVMDEGTHEVTPASADYLTRADLGTLRFIHSDPDGLDSLGWAPLIYLQLPNGGFWNITVNGTDLLDVEHLDDQTVILTLEGQDLMPLLGGDPDEITLWWLVVEQLTGKVRGAEAVYRFTD